MLVTNILYILYYVEIRDNLRIIATAERIYKFCCSFMFYASTSYTLVWYQTL